MVLGNFLIDADIHWDRAGKELYEKPEARTGRIMRVQVTNRGVVEDLTGFTLNLGWKSTIDETKFGLDAFDAVDATKGIFEIEYTSGMLTNIGTLKGALQLVPTVGNTVESNNFAITVTRSAVDAAGVQSESSFSTLTTALVQVNGWNATIGGKVTDWEADMAATKQLYIDNMEEVELTYPQELVSLQGQLEQKASTTALNVEKARIDSFTTLETGSTTGDAELIDGHVGADGITYPNIGGAIRGQLTKVNTDLTKSTGVSRIAAWTSGYIVLDGATANIANIVASGAYKVAVIPCVENDAFTINASGGVAPRTWGFVDANGNVLSVADSGSVATNLVLVAPKNTTHLIINDTTSGISYNGNLLYKISKIETSVTDTNNDLGAVTSQKRIKFISGYYIALNVAIGSPVSLTEVKSATYRYISAVCKEGDRFILNCVGGLTPRAYAFLDVNNNLLSVSPEAYTAKSKTLIAPKNATKLIINDSNSGGICFTGDFAYRVGKVSAKKTATVETMVDADVLWCTDALGALKKNMVIAFFANVTTMGEVKVGVSNASTIYNRVVIDGTTLYTANAGVFPHGLTIANNIAVLIETNFDETAKITIMSNGNIFTQTIPWYRELSLTMPFVTLSSGSSLTKCKLTWSCKDLGKKVWAYGDSYFNPEVTRWPYYANQYGYLNNMLVDGYAGANSSEMLKALKTDLTCSKPQILLWAMGMNDIYDSGSAPNASWLSVVTEVADICRNNNIELVLTTIPSVPTRSNEQKNIWIKASGHRYIDFASAVGANASGVWYSGMLETGAAENVHPSVTGAKALFMQACVDFPEMMLSN